MGIINPLRYPKMPDISDVDSDDDEELTRMEDMLLDQLLRGRR